MNARPDPDRRAAHYEYAWDVPSGTFYATIREAIANRPPSVPHDARLLAQLRYDDDGSFAGQARPVKFRQDYDTDAGQIVDLNPPKDGTA